MPGIAPFIAAMECCDPDLVDHCARVETYAVAIAQRLGWDDDRISLLHVGAALHDVGKVNIRPEILLKPAALTPAEVAEIRAHPVEGLWLLGGMRSLVDIFPYVLFHHERWDGDGYPTRRAGDDIPLEGRVLAIADAFDAMLSNRPYRGAMAFDHAVDEVRRCAGTQFDPGLVEAFLDAVEQETEIVADSVADRVLAAVGS
jgi:HD-GYP domain-containing protein (c-di-GMP phosphodiesterase class II)